MMSRGLDDDEKKRGKANCHEKLNYIDASPLQWNSIDSILNIIYETIAVDALKIVSRLSAGSGRNTSHNKKTFN